MFSLDHLTVPGRLAPLSWHCEQPGLIALIGPNGSGKSSLLLALANLLPAQGQVRLGACSLLDLDMRSASKVRAMLPQRQGSLLTISCLDVLQLGASMLDATPAQVQQVLSVLVARFELEPLLARDFSQLSGGEQQRVLLAKTLLQIWPDLNPHGQLLLLDEPLAGLDWHHQLQVLDLLRELVASGVLVIFSVHDFNLALSHADGLLCLQAGKLVAQGGIEVLDAALLARVFHIRCQRLSDGQHSCLVPVALSSDGV
jgi:vitamin B12 transport system ATP-binding protein